MSEPAPTSPAAPPVHDAATETSPETSPPQTFVQKLKAGEEHCLWKLGLRVFTVIAAIIGIGCMAWALSTPARGDYVWEMDDPWSIMGTVITFGITAIWCTVCVLIVLLRRTHRPVHPGVAVGIDLILWLAYIVTAMFATYGLLNLYSFGSGGYINEYSSSGYYELASNGTWIFNQTSSNSDSYYGSSSNDRDCDRSSRYYQEYNNGFQNCAEEDAYVNQLWNDRSHRIGVETTGVVCQYLCLLLHLALFIWACVDTNRRNRGKVSKDAEKLAANIVMNMVKSGAIVPTQNGMQHPLLQPQNAQGPQMGGWPLAGPAPMGQSPVPMVPPRAATRPEKGESSRFA